MNAKRITAAVVGALVAGVVLGSVVSGYAATTTATPAAKTVASACGTAGLRLGVAMRDSGGRLLDVVAKLTGTTTADVQTKRAAGKTLAQIAAEKNVSSTAVVAEALKVRKTLLDQKVADGTITKAQADAALGNMKTRLTDRVNTANANCDGSGGGQGRGRGAGGMGGGRGAGCGANGTTPAQ